MMKSFLKNTARDALVMGRANVDFYVANPEDSLSDSVMFEKSVGGSAANIAVGLSRLGRNVDFLGRVSDDPFGSFVESFLQKFDVGTQFLRRESDGSLTSLAFAERKKSDSQVLFYRNGASDLMIHVDDIPEQEFSRTAVLIVTGTGLSASPSREATLWAMEAARNAGTKVVLDLDWRVSAWNSMRAAGLVYRMAAEKADIIIGTREEMDVLFHSVSGVDGRADEAEQVNRLLKNQTELVVVKRGPRGSKAYDSDGQSWSAGIYPIEVKKNYGAGDAFAAAFVCGLLEGQAPDEAMRLGAGAAGLVVGSTACAESSPSREDVKSFISSVKEEL